MLFLEYWTDIILLKKSRKEKIQMEMAIVVSLNTHNHVNNSSL